MRILLAFVVAVLGCYLVAASASTFHVIGQLAGMGVELSAADRIGQVVHDWFGLTGIFLPVIGVGLLIGFAVARLLLKLEALSQLPTLAYVSAGAVALLTVHIALNLQFDMHPIAATRTTLGLLLQGVAGAVGGWLFARISNPAARPAAAPGEVDNI